MCHYYENKWIVAKNKKVVQNAVHLINLSLRKYAYFQRYKVVHARILKGKVDQSHDLLLMIS